MSSAGFAVKAPPYSSSDVSGSISTCFGFALCDRAIVSCLCIESGSISLNIPVELKTDDINLLLVFGDNA